MVLNGFSNCISFSADTYLYAGVGAGTLFVIIIAVLSTLLCKKYVSVSPEEYSAEPDVS